MGTTRLAALGAFEPRLVSPRGVYQNVILVHPQPLYLAQPHPGEGREEAGRAGKERAPAGDFSMYPSSLNSLYQSLSVCLLGYPSSLTAVADLPYFIYRSTVFCTFTLLALNVQLFVRGPDTPGLAWKRVLPSPLSCRTAWPSRSAPPPTRHWEKAPCKQTPHGTNRVKKRPHHGLRKTWTLSHRPSLSRTRRSAGSQSKVLSSDLSSHLAASCTESEGWPLFIEHR